MSLPVAVPDKIFGLTPILDFIDRCHSLRSLHPPQAALPSLPNSTTSANTSDFYTGRHPRWGRSLIHILNYSIMDPSPLSTISFGQFCRNCVHQTNKFVHLCLTFCKRMIK